MSQEPTEIQGTWKLVIIEGPDQGQEFILGVISRVGRGKGNDIPLTDEQSSRMHAIIERTAVGLAGDQFGYIINDRGSTNGTFIDGQRISGPTPLEPGQVIKIGDSLLRVQSPSQAEAIPTVVAPPADETAPPITDAAPLAAETVPSDSEDAEPKPEAPLPAPSPGVEAAPVRPAPKRRRRWWLTCLILLVALACVLSVAAAGGYYAVTSGLVSRRTVLNTVGFGYGEVSFINLTDSTLDAQMDPLDASEDSPQLEYEDQFAPLDIGGWGGIQPGRYQLELRFDGPPETGSCTLQIGSGDSYQFVAVPEGIAITLKGAEATSPDALDVQTSFLCRR